MQVRFQSGYKTEREIDNGTVNRKHDCILDDSGRQKYHEAFSIEHGDPQCIQTAVDNELNKEFCNQYTPDADGLLVQDGAK